MEKDYQEIIKKIKKEAFETKLQKELGNIKSTSGLAKRMSSALFEYILIIMDYITVNELDRLIIVDLLEYIKRIDILKSNIDGLSKSVVFAKNLKICIHTDIINSNTSNSFNFSYTESYINELTKVAKNFNIRSLTH